MKISITQFRGDDLPHTSSSVHMEANLYGDGEGSTLIRDQIRVPKVKFYDKTNRTNHNTNSIQTQQRHHLLQHEDNSRRVRQA